MWEVYMILKNTNERVLYDTAANKATADSWVEYLRENFLVKSAIVVDKSSGQTFTHNFGSKK